MTTFDNFPEPEFYQMIFDYLEISDLFTLRLVNRKLRNIVGSYRFIELIFVLSKEILIKNKWYSINRPLNAKRLIDYSKFSIISSPLLNFKALKRLKICGCEYNGTFELINKLTSLQHLEIEFETNEQKIIPIKTSLSLPNLEILYLKPADQNFLVFDLPNLKNLHFLNLNTEFRFIYCLSVKSLTSITFRSEFFVFKNLACLELTYSNRLGDELLYNFSNLKILRVVYDNMDKLPRIIEQKFELGRLDLKVFCYGVQLLDILHLNRLLGVDRLSRLNSAEYRANNSLSFCIQNYQLLMDDIWWIEMIRFDELIRLMNSVPRNFHQKFSNIVEICVSSRIERVDYFICFLKSCHYLLRLKLAFAELDQLFFEQLADLCKLKTLWIHENRNSFHLDLKFIIKMNYLTEFKTNIVLDPAELLKNSKQLSYLEFSLFNETRTETMKIIISTASDNQSNLYEFEYCMLPHSDQPAQEKVFQNVNLDGINILCSRLKSIFS